MLMRLKVVTSFTLGRGNSDPCTQGFGRDSSHLEQNTMVDKEG